MALLFAFDLPVKSGLKYYEYKKPSDETLHMLRNKCQYLKVLIIDEISMMQRETLGHLDVALKAIMQNLSPFSGVSLLVVRDFLQLPPDNQKGVFMKPSKESYRSFSGWLSEKLQLHEVVEIVWQSCDPDFAQLLNRVQEVQQTDDDVIQIKALANTDTATGPDKFVKAYLNNYLAGQESEDFIDKLDSKVNVIKAQDGNKDTDTYMFNIYT